MILVFGGTTEGKQAISVLRGLECPFVYSTKTKVEVPASISYRYGALDAVQLKQLILDQAIDLIINCAHPFAEQLHATIDEVASFTKTTVLRLEREYPERSTHPLVTYVEGYDEAMNVLDDHVDETLLALTGVQSIPKLKKHWRSTRTYFRILDRQDSRDIAIENEFPREQLILGLTDKSLDAELQTIDDNAIEIILTKESGESGGLSVKIAAAIQRGIPIVILKKPTLPSAFKLVKNQEELQLRVLSYELGVNN